MEKSDFIKYTETDIANVGLTKSGILYVNIKVRNAFDLDHSKKITKLREEIGDHKKRPVLFTTTSTVLFPTQEVSKFLISEERTKFILAEAYVINSLQQRLEGKLYVKSMKPKTPVNFFSTENEAVNWLSEFVEDL